MPHSARMTSTEEYGGDGNTIGFTDRQALAETIEALDAMAKNDPSPRILELLNSPAATDGSDTNADVVEIVTDIAAECSASTKELAKIVADLRAYAAAEISTDEDTSAIINATEG